MTFEQQQKANNRYRNKRAKQGWIWFSRICPPALATELKYLCRDWKIKNPGVYRDESEFYKGEFDPNNSDHLFRPIPASDTNKNA